MSKNIIIPVNHCTPHPNNISGKGRLRASTSERRCKRKLKRAHMPMLLVAMFSIFKAVQTDTQTGRSATICLMLSHNGF